MASVDTFDNLVIMKKWKAVKVREEPENEKLYCIVIYENSVSYNYFNNSCLHGAKTLYFKSFFGL